MELRTLFTSIIALFIFQTAQARVLSANGSGDWNDSSLWEVDGSACTCVPSSTDTVSLDGWYEVTIPSGEVVNINSLFMDGRQDLIIEGSLTVEHDLTMDNGTGMLRVLIVDGGLLSVNNVYFNTYKADRVLIEMTGGDFMVAGNFNFLHLYGKLDMSGGTLTFNATTERSVIPGDQILNEEWTYYNVVLDSQTPLTLGSPLTIYGTMTFTNGILSTTETNLLIFEDEALVAGGSDASHVDGPVKKIGKKGVTGGNVFVFPTGDQGEYGPIGIGQLNSVTASYTAEYFFEDPNTAVGADYDEATLSGISDKEYWYLMGEGTNSFSEINLYWDDHSGIITPLDVEIAKFVDNSSASARMASTGIWELVDGSSSGTVLSGSVESDQIVEDYSTGFVTFGNPDITVLPVDIVSFVGNADESSIGLEWEIASNLDNNGFQLQRSKDGISFEDYAWIDPSDALNYEISDEQPSRGWNYYRLKQTEDNGEEILSKVVAVYWDGNVAVYPSLMSGNEALNIAGLGEGTVNLTIVDLKGRVHWAQELVIGEGQTVSIDFAEGLASGQYIVRLQELDWVDQVKLVVR